MVYRIQIRRDTAANWTSANPTLAEGEMGYETDTGLTKVGDGTNDWNTLGYNFTGPAGPAGADGADGPAGADGAQGPAGADGADATPYTVVAKTADYTITNADNGKVFTTEGATANIAFTFPTGTVGMVVFIAPMAGGYSTHIKGTASVTVKLNGQNADDTYYHQGGVGECVVPFVCVASGKWFAMAEDVGWTFEGGGGGPS